VGKIYRPSGKAREYSPLALNIFLGCDQNCSYCFTPSILRREHANEEPEERPGLLINLAKELEKNPPREQVLLCFMGDPYCHLDERTHTTAGVLQLFLHYKVPTAILTKGGRRSLRDIDLMKKFGPLLKFGATLTFVDDRLRKEWEPNASETMERLEVLQEMHEAGIKTWASIEPVIDPIESLAAIALSVPFCDEYRVGKLNHNAQLEGKVDWAQFLKDVVFILRAEGKQFYVKEDLRAFDVDKILRPEECDADALAVKVK
jgi:DNA repair photolyase